MPDLVDEQHDAIRLGDRSRQLAQRLAHQAGLQAGQAVAHLALDLGPGRQRRDRVDHHDVYGARSHQGVDNLKRLFAGVGLRHQQVVQIDAQLLGIAGIQRMLGVDEGGRAAGLLDFSHGMQGQRRLARALRPEHLDDAATRQATNAQRHVEAQRTGRDGRNLRHHPALAKLHHRALAEGAVDLCDRRLQRALLVAVVLAHQFQIRLSCHLATLPCHDSHLVFGRDPPGPAPCEPQLVHGLFLLPICSFRSLEWRDQK